MDCEQCSEKEQDLRGCVRYDPEYEIEEVTLTSTGKAAWVFRHAEVEIKGTFQLGADFYFTFCPYGVVTEESCELLNDYNLCKDIQSLPYEGGLYDQPAYLVQAFRIIASEYAQSLELKREERERRGKVPPKK